MNKFLSVLEKNYSIFLLLFFLHLFPFMFAFDANNEDIWERIGVSFVYVLLTSTVLVLIFKKVRLIVTILVCLIVYIPNVIVLSYLLMDNVIMKSTDFWVIFNTNFQEATNLFSTLPVNVFIWVTVYTVLIIVGVFWTAKKDSDVQVPMWVQILSLTVLLCVSLINPFRSKVAMIDFYKSFYKYNKEKHDVADFYKSRKDLILDVERMYPAGKNTILIIIGESQNRQHSQLYGYQRQTNPQLSEIRDELTIYKDVCSPAIQTLASMKQILTFSNYEAPDLYKMEANIIELLRSGGYKTFWFDNQGGEKNAMFAIDVYTPTSYRIMAQQSDVFCITNEYDSVLLGKLKNALSDTVSNKAIFLHLMGNHFEYSQRYEEAFSLFCDSTNVRGAYRAKFTEEDINVINAYDNSVCYTDYILRSCVEMLRAAGGRSAMLYFSDHGEEVFDYQYYYRRSFEKISPAMCEIPLILWMNDKYKDSHELTLDPQRPYCTDDIIYSIMDISGIRYSTYDSTRSIFSSSFCPKERKVHGIPYESIVAKYK